MIDPVAVAGLAISAVSLVVSGAVAYVAEFRGPSMAMDLLRPPSAWRVNPGRPAPGKPPGIWHLADLDAAFTLMVSGECPGRVWNDGSKGGAVWDLALEVDGLPLPWSANGQLDITDPYTLDGKANSGIHARFVLLCARERLEEGVARLEMESQPLEFVLTYSGFKSFARTSRRQSRVRVAARDVAARVRQWAEEAGFELR